MAGIGFDLRKIFYTQKGLEKAKVSLQSLFITSGPWIISIFTIAILKIINESLLEKTEFNAVVSVFIYAFVFSNIISSPFTNLVTRYISDLLYLKKTEKVLSVFLTGFLIIGIFSFFLAYFYILNYTNLKNFVINISYLFTSLNILWFVMVFVSMLKEHKRVTNGFLCGMIVVVILNIFYAKGNFAKTIDSFTIGVCFSIYYLVSILFSEFNFNRKLHFEWLFKIEYYPLILSGFFLYSGMWADKLIYWFFSNKKIMLIKGFYFFPAYDFATFLAYLTIIPTTAFFVIFIETNFYETQRNYLHLLETNGKLSQIKEKEEDVINNFYKSVLNIIYFQLIITIFFIIIIPPLLDYFNIMVQSIPLLKITTIDAMLQMIFNVLIIFLYYFDFQKETTAITFLLFLTNATFTYILKDFPYEYTGYSYFFSLIIANLVAFITAKYKLEKVTFYILTANS